METIGYWHETEGNITEVLYAGEEKDTAGIKLDVQMIQYDSHEEKRFKDLIENFDDYKLKAGNGCLSVTESGIRAVKPGWCPIFLEKDYRDTDNLKHRIQACIGLYLVSVNVLSNLVADSKIILEGKEYSISSEEKFSYTFS